MFLSCTAIPQCKKSPICQIGDFCTLMPYWPIVMVLTVRRNSGQMSQNWDKSMRASYRYGVWQTEFLVFQGADGNRVISEHKLAICWHGVKFLVQKNLKFRYLKNFENGETGLLLGGISFNFLFLLVLFFYWSALFVDFEQITLTTYWLRWTAFVLSCILAEKSLKTLSKALPGECDYNIRVY